jgi:hypothetical protein
MRGPGLALKTEIEEQLSDHVKPQAGASASAVLP